MAKKMINFLYKLTDNINQITNKIKIFNCKN